MSEICGCPADAHPTIEPVGAVLPGLLAELAARDGNAPEWVGDAGRESPVTEGNCGTMGATTKAAPAVRQHCESGASPTEKESTDG